MSVEDERSHDPRPHPADRPSATPSYYHREILVSCGDQVVRVMIDPYAVARLWALNDPALFHAFKKIMCPGQRGGKSRRQDISEARDALTRWLELDEAERKTEGQG